VLEECSARPGVFFTSLEEEASGFEAGEEPDEDAAREVLPGGAPPHLALAAGEERGGVAYARVRLVDPAYDTCSGSTTNSPLHLPAKR
jgi:hypothetical protein